MIKYSKIMRWTLELKICLWKDITKLSWLRLFNQDKVKVKLSPFSRGWPEGSSFDSYYTEA